MLYIINNNIIIIKHAGMMLAIFIAIFFISPGLCESQNIRTTCTGETVYYNPKTNTCEQCTTTCPAGYGYFEYKCGNGQMKRERCNECIAGDTFSTDGLRCQPCNLCLNRQTITICTTSSKAMCGSCDDDYGWDNFRKECKQCEVERKELPLPGCEPPPKVTFSKMQDGRIDCDASADKYSWFRNGEILDTSDKTKFADLGKMLVILEPDTEDADIYYECRAEWKADNNHNFNIMKMSSNKAEVSVDKQETHTTTIKEEIVTETKNEYVPNKHTKSSTTVTCSVNCNCFKSLLVWVVVAILCVVFLIIGMCIPITPLEKIFNWLCDKINIRITCKDPRVEIDPSSITPGIPESEFVNLEEVLIDTGQSSSETSGLMEKTNQSKDNLGSLYQLALEGSSGLFYQDLNISTTDRLGVLLNPCNEPQSPIKFWKHLADELNFKDQAELNHLGSYKAFHNLLLTRNIPMQQFLEALWKVENAEATGVVCNAVIKMQKSS